MKTLYLVRHAKAISQELGLNDFKRVLAKQGLEDAKAMGKCLKKKEISPDLFLSSPADRALETAHIFAKELDYSVQNILLKDELYDEDLRIILEVLKSLPDSHDNLMLFGHEPTLSQLAALFLKDTGIEFTASGVAGIVLDIENWQALDDAAGTLVFFDFPVRATSKVYKKARKALAGEIRGTLEKMLEDIDPGASTHLEKPLKKTSKELAKQLTKVLRASKVEDIAKVREGQRLDRREEFERDVIDSAATPKTPVENTVPDTDGPVRKTSATRKTPVRRSSTRRKTNPQVNTPDKLPQDTRQTEAEKNPPAPKKATRTKKAPVRRSSTRRKASPQVNTPDELPQDTKQTEAEKNPPAPKKATRTKKAPVRRSSTRRKTSPQVNTPDELPQDTRQAEAEKSPPAPKTATRRRSTRRNTSETKTNPAPATRRRRTSKNMTTDSENSTSGEQE